MSRGFKLFVAGVLILLASVGITLASAKFYQKNVYYSPTSVNSSVPHGQPGTTLSDIQSGVCLGANTLQVIPGQEGCQDVFPQGQKKGLPFSYIDTSQSQQPDITLFVLDVILWAIMLSGIALIVLTLRKTHVHPRMELLK